MCGILGVIETNVASRWDALTFKKALIGMSNRGPDRQKVWQSRDGIVTFGHARLAIQDLTTKGDQPISLNDENYCMVFNGEIYNFKDLRADLLDKGFSFKSDSDSEVLLAAYICYGHEVLSRLNGMFAFAIYDKRDESVFLARDPSGQKPLFYRQGPNYFEFCSTLEGLLENINGERN